MTSEILTPEQVAKRRFWADVDPAGVTSLADSHEALRAQLTAMEKERDEWRALTISPRGAQYYIDKAAQAEADRDRLAAEVERLWALLQSGAWHRRDGRTYLAIRLADGADLSCRATREDAIRAALSDVPTSAREEGGQ